MQVMVVICFTGDGVGRRAKRVKELRPDEIKVEVFDARHAATQAHRLADRWNDDENQQGDHALTFYTEVTE